MPPLCDRNKECYHEQWRAVVLTPTHHVWEARYRHCVVVGSIPLDSARWVTLPFGQGSHVGRELFQVVTTTSRQHSATYEQMRRHGQAVGDCFTCCKLGRWASFSESLLTNRSSCVYRVLHSGCKLMVLLQAWATSILWQVLFKYSSILLPNMCSGQTGRDCWLDCEF